jgi:protein gp37
MNKTSIEWTHRPGTVGMTWNPIWACTHASPGCLHCYAETINKRFGTGLPFSVPALSRVEFYLDEKILQEPLKTKKPCTIFVGDMFDLFHEAIPLEMIEQVFLVIVQAKQHTFQLLTKRAERMQKLISTIMYRPHPHIWFGVSVESQKYADERIPLLLQTPAEIRFLSVEPQLEPVDLRRVIDPRFGTCLDIDALSGIATHEDDNYSTTPTNKIDWVICGGESGPKARPFNLAWAESLRAQCKAAGVPFFMKQVGSFPVIARDRWFNPLTSEKRRAVEQWLSAKNDPRLGENAPNVALAVKDRKGGDPSEWPAGLRVREFPG